MNLLKSFSDTTGLQPGKSFLYEKFYPLDFSKYIVLDTQSLNPNFHYVFWFRVIELIEPILAKQDIKIVHFIEDKKYHFNHTYVDNSSSLSERAYLIRKALLFCGSSKLYSLIASENNVKQCFLKTDYVLNNTLVKDEDIIHSDKVRKNFLNPTGIKINNIRPEEIAKRILKSVLGEDHIFDNTISIGKVFSAQNLEVIPDCTFKTNNNAKNEIVIRMDYLFSEENLDTLLSYQPCVILTNKTINKNILTNRINNIKKIYFKVEKNSDSSFIDTIEELKIDYDIITTLTVSDLESEKIKFFNYKKINRLNSLSLDFLDGLDKSKVYFKTNKIVIKSGKTFASKWHSKVLINSPDVRLASFQLPPVIDQSFKDEADYFYFLTSEQI
jgi:hypothetical protein